MYPRIFLLYGKVQLTIMQNQGMIKEVKLCFEY